MGKRLFTLGAFIFLATFTLIVSVRVLLSARQRSIAISTSRVLGETTDNSNPEIAPILINSNPTIQSVSGEPLLADARPLIIKNYLERWHSPLASYSRLIVNSADLNGVDPLLVVAIAQQESNLGRRVISDCYNAWGWAQTSVYTRCFSSWEQGIKDYTKEFSDNYIKKGLTTPEQIMTRYNPTSPDGSWAKGVNQFMGELVSSAS